MSLRRSTRVSSQLLNGGDPIHEQTNQVQKRRATNGTTRDTPSKKARKSADAPMEPDEASFKKPALPSTPNKRRTATKSKAPPLTPTPSLVKAIRAPLDNPDLTNTPPPLNRPVDPHVSNATLVTPGGTQNVAYPNYDASTNPPKLSIPKPTSTTGTLLTQACAHLISTDPRFAPLIASNPCSVWSPAGLNEKIDPFVSLVSSIIGQQVSGAAANAIKSKFVALFQPSSAPPPPTSPAAETTTKPSPTSFPTPAQVLTKSIPELRTAGLSQRKAEYITGLAEAFHAGTLTTAHLTTCSDDDLLATLIAIRGLGRWTVEMFATFALKRMDILSTGDLGVQRGMAAWFGRDVEKLKYAKGGGGKGGGKWKYMSEGEMLERAEPYRPYRSLFMWYMWRVQGTDVSVMADGEGDA